MAGNDKKNAGQPNDYGDGVIMIPETKVYANPENEWKEDGVTSIPMNSYGGMKGYPDTSNVKGQGLIQWWVDAGFDDRPGHERPVPPQPEPPKMIPPKGSKDGSGIYQIERNGKLVNVTVDVNGHGTVSDNSVPEKDREEAVLIAEGMFRREYNKSGIRFTMDDRKKLTKEQMAKFIANKFPVHNMFFYTDKNGQVTESTDPNAYRKEFNAFDHFFSGFLLSTRNNQSIYKITRNAVKEIYNAVGESFKALQQKGAANTAEHVDAAGIFKFTNYPGNSVANSDFDLINVMDARNFISDNNVSNLKNLADNNKPVTAPFRVAVTKNSDNTGFNAYLVRTDGVLISGDVPVYSAQYTKSDGWFVAGLQNLRAGFSLLPNRGFGAAGLLPAAGSRGFYDENKKMTFPEKVDFTPPPSVEKIPVPAPHQINDAVVVFPAESNIPPVYIYAGYPGQIYLDEKDTRDEQDKEFNQVKDAVKFTADFYKDIFRVHGEKASQLAKALEAQARGKKIRNAEDAARAWEKHKADPGKKINAKDRAAIAKWLESVDTKIIADNFKRFSKGMGYIGPTINAYELYNELKKAIETDNWRPFFVKTEAIVAGGAATIVVAFAFGTMIGNPIGLVGYGLIMAGVGFMIDDEFVEMANKFFGI